MSAAAFSAATEDGAPVYTGEATPPPMRKSKSGGGRPSRYLTSKGEKVPSVTTILSRFKESGALVHWAWKLGMERKDYRQVRDAAASRGSVVHAVSEKWLRGISENDCLDEIAMKLPRVEDAVQATKQFHSVQRWVEEQGIEIIQSEVPLVSERIRTAGCIDHIDAARRQIDLKTGKNVYVEHVLQVAAYDLLHELVRGEPFSSCIILHVPQEGEDCIPYDCTWAIPEARAAFLSLRIAYEMDPMLRRAVEKMKC